MKPSLAACAPAEGESQVWLVGWIVQTNCGRRHRGRDSPKPMPQGECTPKQKLVLLAASGAQPHFPGDAPRSCGYLMCSHRPRSPHHPTEPHQHPVSPNTPRQGSWPVSPQQCGLLPHCFSRVLLTPGRFSPIRCSGAAWPGTAHPCALGLLTDPAARVPGPGRGVDAELPRACVSWPQTDPSPFCQLI